MRPAVDADNRAAAAWDIVGVFFILGVGSLLHFLFRWSGNSLIAAPFAAVNESVWEHLKLAFWPAAVWTLMEWGPLKTRVNNFWLARALGAALMPLLIVVFYYFCVFLLGETALFLDITIFIVAVLVGQYVSYRLLTGDERSPFANQVAPAAFVVLAVLFILFTFTPPHVGLFLDSITQSYGMPR